MTTKERVTVKSIIEDGIKNGYTSARILKDVAKKKPDSKADETHIKYYSGQLKRAGEIDEETHQKYSGKKGRPTAEKPAAKKAAEKPAAKKAVEKPAAKKPAAKKAAEKPVKKTRVKKA